MMNQVLLPGFMQVQFVTPHDLGGWLQVNLDKTEMDYLWGRIKAAEERDENIRSTLAGQLSASLALDDKDDYFQNNILQPLAKEYLNQQPLIINYIRGNRMSSETQNDDTFNMLLDQWWVNKQKQGEFNPIHNHSGLFSFVVWMHEPVENAEQNKQENAKTSNRPCHHEFCFHYSTMTSHLTHTAYPLGKELEGTMLLFPSELFHSVNPFFNNDGIRISIAGNIGVKGRWD